MSDDSNEDVCAVCQGSDVASDDVLISCDACKLLVHAACYSITKIPKEEDAWFCYACVAGFQPTNTSCSLCAQKGGAFKRTATIDGQQAQNWVHCICANWIPEIDEEPDKNVKAGPKVHLEKMLKERSRLKCNKCSGRSGCVQCSHGRCTQAIHPYCMLQGDGSFTWRVVETETALGIPVYRRELYCTAHLNDVAEPMKRGEMLIQVDSLSPITWNDDYAPVLKPEYRSDPAYAELLKITQKRPRASSTDSAEGSSAANKASKRKGKGTTPSTTGKLSGRKRKLTPEASAYFDRLHQPSPRQQQQQRSGSREEEERELFPRGVPMKRPKASVLQMVSRRQTGVAQGDSPAAGPRGDRRAPSAQRARLAAGSTVGHQQAPPSPSPVSLASKQSATGAGNADSVDLDDLWGEDSNWGDTGNDAPLTAAGAIVEDTASQGRTSVLRCGYFSSTAAPTLPKAKASIGKTSVNASDKASTAKKPASKGRSSASTTHSSKRGASSEEDDSSDAPTSDKAASSSGRAGSSGRGYSKKDPVAVAGQLLARVINSPVTRAASSAGAADLTAGTTGSPSKRASSRLAGLAPGEDSGVDLGRELANSAGGKRGCRATTSGAGSEKSAGRGSRSAKSSRVSTGGSSSSGSGLREGSSGQERADLPPLSAVAPGMHTLQVDAHTIAQLQRALALLSAAGDGSRLPAAGGSEGAEGTGPAERTSSEVAVGLPAPAAVTQDNSSSNSSGGPEGGSGVVVSSGSSSGSSAGNAIAEPGTASAPAPAPVPAAATDVPAAAAVNEEVVKLRMDLESQRHMTKRAADRCYQLAQENETLRIERDKLCDKLRRLEEHRQRKKERKAAKQQGQQN